MSKVKEEKAELVQKVEALSFTCEQLRSQCDQLEIDNSSRTEEIEEEKCLRLSALDENLFWDNDEKVWFYTRLTNWSILHTLFTYVQSYLCSILPMYFLVTLSTIDINTNAS